MTTLIVAHDVADYDAWRPVFDQHGASRKEHGCTDERVYRAVDNANSTVVVMTYPSREDVEAFLADPSLHEAMARAGVTSEPIVTIA